MASQNRQPAKLWGFTSRIALPCLLLIALLEISLRLFTNMPQGKFAFIVTSTDGMYTPNRTYSILWGGFEYTINTTKEGFRSTGPLPSRCDSAAFSVAAIGDSFTDGFFVQDIDTYPSQLQDFLNSRGACVRVLNIAHGQASIADEFAAAKEVAVPLHPNAIILQFVTNDIAEMGDHSFEALLSKSRRKTLLNQYTTRFFSDTAIGEAFGTLMLWALAPHRISTEFQDLARSTTLDPATIPLQLDRFIQGTKNSDQLISRSPFTESTRERIQMYLRILAELNNYLKTRKIALIFAFTPSFDQLYDETSSLEIRNILETACKKLHVDFIDLTPNLLAQSKVKKIHLSPIDPHFNQLGHQIVATTIGSYLGNKYSAQLGISEPNNLLSDTNLAK